MQFKLSLLGFAKLSIGFGVVATLILAGCGGGAKKTQSTAISYPSSGNYAWLLTAQGSQAAPKLGLSFVHPADSATEYAIEPPSVSISDVKVVSSGTVTVGTQAVSNIRPYALLYIVAGEVRRVPLLANGVAPAMQVKKSGNIGACNFTVDANDYAIPDQSRFIVSTAGLDGQCGTVDDGQREIALGAAGGISSAPVLNTVLGVLHDEVTLAPKGWVLGGGIYWWSLNNNLVMRVNADPLITKVVAGNYKTIIAEYNNQLTVWQVTNAPLAVETKLNSPLTAGTGWGAIGYDATNFYVYRNSNPLAACTATSTWSVLRVSIVSPVATQLASGAGCVASASMGASVLYATVLSASANSLLKIDKALVGATQTVESAVTTTLSTVLTSASGVHQLWRVTNVNTNPGYTIEMINEAGSVLYSGAGGFPVAMVDPTTVNLNISENRTGFMFVTRFGYTSRQFGDTSLILYDATLSTARTLGDLPGTVGFGVSFPAFYTVYANVIGASTDFTAGLAVPVISGVLQDAGTKVFSVNTATANSLKFSSTKR